MLNQHHKSQLRGKNEVLSEKLKFIHEKLVKEFRATSFSPAKESPRIHPANRTILDYQTVNARQMRIKRESPCLGLRFMPIKLSEFLELKFRFSVTSRSSHVFVRFPLGTGKHFLSDSCLAFSEMRVKNLAFIYYNYIKQEDFRLLILAIFRFS
jgi:hypothetical protein